MKIDRVIVSAGRTFNHPHEDFSNLRPEVKLEATLDPGEDPFEATRQLQAKAEGMVEDHKQNMLRSLEELHQMKARRAEIQGLQRQLQGAQDRLDTIRKEHPELALEAPKA